MPLILNEIELDPKSFKVLDFLSKIGGTRLRGSREQKLVTLTNKLNELALDAYRSKVPYDTGELAETQIVITKRATQKLIYASVGVIDATHYGNGDPKPAPLLASMLDEGIGEKGQALHYKHGSHARGPYRGIGSGSTAGWIKKARTAYLNQERRLFSQLAY